MTEFGVELPRTYLAPSTSGSQEPERQTALSQKPAPMRFNSQQTRTA